MAESYKVKIIKPEEKDRLLDGLVGRKLHDRKASLHGMCIELLTDNIDFKESWEDNFRTMSDDIRPHGRVIAIDTEKKGGIKVLYEPISKTCFMMNCDYYGYAKSLALAVAADFLEDYHSIHSRFSVHGSCIDFEGRGAALIAPSGTGKTTHSFGLLLSKNATLVSDDWFFVRLAGDVVAYASEKNSYIRDDLGRDFDIFKEMVSKTKLDSRRRGVANIEDALGVNRRRRSTVVKVVMIMKRDRSDKNVIRQIGSAEAVDYLKKNDFCNPHQLVRDSRKMAMREAFFRNMMAKLDVYMVNTIKPVDETQKQIRKIIEEKLM